MVISVDFLTYSPIVPQHTVTAPRVLCPPPTPGGKCKLNTPPAKIYECIAL